MSSRIPPSQRDRSNLAAALRQTDRQVRSLSGPGYFGGRLGIPQPIPGSTHLDALLDDDDGDGTEANVDSPVWEDRDRYALSTADVVLGYFRHQLLHTEIVEEYEFTAYLNGVALDPSRYILDPVNGVVIMTLAGWEKKGFRYRFVYAYTGIDTSVPLTPTTFSKVGATSSHALSGNNTTLAWPAGTQAGDLFALGLIAGSVSCSDSRAKPVGAHKPMWSDAEAAVWAGEVGNPATAMTFNAVGAASWGWASMLYVIRPADPVGWSSHAVSGADATITIPGISGDVSGAVGMAFSAGGIGGSYGWSWPSPWTGRSSEGTYFVIETDLQVAEEIAPTGALTTYQSYAWVLGVDLV